jgi:predicted TIM-barrel fold metal-dependent hydrolase
MTSYPKVITIEEHFTSPKLRELRGEKDTPVQRKLDDLGALRIREMDEAGIDLQVISENNPATQKLEADSAVKLARASNDLLYQAVRVHPTDLPDLPRCQHPIRTRQPMSWNAR